MAELKFLSNRGLSDRSQQLYTQVLRYWGAWYQLRFGSALPVADSPPSALPPLVWRRFCDDHMAMIVAGRLGSAMDHQLTERFQRILVPYAGTVPASATTAAWHLGVISAIHRRLGLSCDKTLVHALSARLTASMINARRVLGESDAWALPMSLIIGRLRSSCPDTREGVQMAALVTLLQHLSSRQAAELRFADMEPFNLCDRQGHKLSRGIDLFIRQPRDLDQRMAQTRFLDGADADAVYLWGAVRLIDTFGERSRRMKPPGRTFFFVRDMPGELEPQPVTPHWVANRLRRLVLRAGLTSRHQRRGLSAEIIRAGYRLEAQEQRRLVQIAKHARLKSLKSVERIARNV